mgnify:CR=1 FL=1|uniref:protein-glutamate O-methyltransferase n=1 Tax=Schlesneria paludicola TaxID=360056 RepID=A0A7C4LLL0_9PLAN
MNSSDYAFLSHMLMEKSGLALGPGKEYLVESRLTPLAQSYGLKGISQLVRHLQSGREPRLHALVVEAMTTNETLFFRDRTPFDDLQHIVLPELITRRAKVRRIRIWSAAVSTGQEIYSVAMLLDRVFPHLRDWHVELLASDISEAMLDRARKGVYSDFEVQRGLSDDLRDRCFEQYDNQWRIKEHLRRRITWLQLNLLDPFAHLGMWDVILCRNVLIYFDLPTKRDILERMHQLLASDGCLLLGAAETVLGVSARYERYQRCASAVYRPLRDQARMVSAAVFG